MIGQSETIAPADRRMYALRDVTATVESIPLIAASIMSKKIAAGPDALVMDVKTGSGAFMSDPADAEALAKTLVAVGRETGMPVVALLTDMNQPLGRAVGNAVEVVEAIEFLQGGGPADFREVVLALSAEMLVLGERAESTEAARSKLETCIEDGSAMARFAELIEAQEGDAGILENPAAKLGIDALEEDAVTADRDGFIAEFDTQRVGIASMILGAGRRTVNDAIDHAVGLYVEKKPGDRVRRGETIFRLLYRDSERRAAAVQCLEGVVRIEEEAPDVPSLLKSRIDASILTDEES
jgi:pyrimidine-nucleoside phosphorylase